MSRKQCKKCPWKVSVDPNDIPNGYSKSEHEKLKNTIAIGSALEQVESRATFEMMACHKTDVGDEEPCVGWLNNQLGIGNNIILRAAVSCGSTSGSYELDGEQHERFEDTLP